MNKIAILMGGPSAEHDISLKSGKAVLAALEGVGVAATPVVLTTDELPLPADTDVVFVALHGTFGEDGTVQRLLEERGLPYTFSGPEASAQAFDKIRSKQAFSAAGIPTPRSLVIDRKTRAFSGLRDFSWPVVVKPARQGSSIGVMLAADPSELKRAALEAGQYGDQLLIEERVVGREFTVGVLGERALPVIEICPNNSFFNYQAKYTAGQTEYRVPAPLEDSVRERAQQLALEAHQCLGCRDLSRVDLMMDDRGELFVLEVNTIPGFTETSLVPKAAKAAGLSFAELCLELVKKARRRADTAVVA